MDFRPAPGVAQFTLTYQTPGGVAENVYHVHKDAGVAWTLSELAAMCNVFSNWEQTTGRQQRSTLVVNTATLGRDLTTQAGIETAVPGTSAGTITGGAAPDNVTLAVKKNTGFVGRSFRGRVYWIGVPLSKVTGDSLDGTWATAVTNALNTLHDNINAVTGFHYCLLRGQFNGSLLNPREEVPISSHSTVDTIIDSQRRRLPGRGK